MKSLLENQECRIDNHQAGQTTKKLNGLHIHKTYKRIFDTKFDIPWH